MRQLPFSILLSALCVSLSPAAPVALTGTGTYTQNFDTLATSGTANAWTDDSTLEGWYAQRQAGTVTLRAHSPSDNSGSLYSFGTGTETDRALGSISSGTPQTITFGVQFQNTSASAVSVGTIAFNGEQWRNGGNTSTQTLTLWYRLSGTAITDLSPAADTDWTALTAGDFVSPIASGTAAGLNGNDPANRRALSFNAALTVPAGQFLMLRWKDINDAGSDHGLGIDDLSVSYAAATGGAITLAVDPATASETAGATAATGTVTLSAPAPAGGLAVALSSNDADSSEITLPASVTVPEGETTATFALGTKTDGVFDGPQAISLLATATDFSPGTATFTVTDADPAPTLVITEIYDATATGPVDMNGNGSPGFNDAYVEITNTGTATVDLSGLLIRTNGNGTAGVRHTFPAGTTLAPGAIHLLFQSVAPATPPHPAFTGFATVTGTTSDFLIMGDSSDEITLTTASGAVISSFFYLNGSPGTALVRDTDGTIISHELATTSGGLPYSPGRRTDGTASPAITQTGFFLSAPTPPDILEKDTPASGFPQKATFTAYRVASGNAGDLVVNLASSDPANATVPASVTIPAGQNSATFEVTGVTDNAQDPASVKLGSVWVTPVTLTGTYGSGTHTGKVNVIDAERLNLLIPSIFASASSIAEGDPAGAVLTVGIAVALETDITLTVAATVNGTQVTLANGGLVTLAAGNTTADLAVVAVDDPDADGPKAVTISVSGPGYEPASIILTVTDNEPFPLVINEILYDPNEDANGDGSTNQTTDEFVELVNTGSAALDLSGWKLTDNASTNGPDSPRHTFPAGTVLNPGQALVVFGGGNPAAIPGVVVQAATTAQLGLNNGDDTVRLFDTSNTLVLDLAYTGGTSEINESVTRNPELTGALALHSTVNPAKKQSPGTRADGTAFGTAPTGYAAWTASAFGADASNPAIAGINADPDGDGVVNLIEYGLGTSPTSPAQVRRIVSTQTSTGYTLTYTAPTVPPTGVTYVLEAAPAPAGPWTIQLPGSYSASLTDNGNGTSTVTLTRPFNGDTEFLRLRIAIP